MTIRIVFPGRFTSLFAAVMFVSGAAPGVAQSPGIGIGVGDDVTVGTGFGWVDATVLAVEGHEFRVRIGGGEGVAQALSRPAAAQGAAHRVRPCQRRLRPGG